MRNYRRYTKFTKEGKSLIVPFIPIPHRDTDYYEIYEIGKTRLDILSNKFYTSPDYAWLIMQANPHLGSLEYLIQAGSEIRIPYPLDVVLSQYDSDIVEYDNMYGIE
jgi:hypothetical protein